MRELAEPPRVQRRAPRAVTSATPSTSRRAVGERGDQLVALARPELAELVAQALVLLDDPARPLERGARILRVERPDEIRAAAPARR